MARDHHNSRRFGEKSGMHLFDFNETLSGKRLPDERRGGLEYQMEKIYKSRAPPSDLHSGNQRASARQQREDVELMRNVPKMPGKMYGAPGGGGSNNSINNREIEAKQRGPSVVARLMGLDTLPNESKGSPGEPPKHSRKKQAERKPEKTPVSTPKPERHHQLEAQRMDHHQHNTRFTSEERRRSSGMRELPELHELEEMKRQLSLKQMLVREKLNEAKRLLTGEKLSEKKWLPAVAAGSDRLNQSKEFLDAIDFFQSNRDAFLRYVDDQDSVLGKHIHSSSKQHQHLPRGEQRAAPPPVPESMRNPIVRKVIEGRREDVLRNSSGRSSDYGGGSDESFRHPVPESQVATRIVVLKPSPNRASPQSFSPGPFEYPKAPPAPQGATGRRAMDSSGDEATTNPREIAKEIARQVRESVVRDLARSAATELGSERRLSVPLESFDGPKLGRSEFVTREGAASPARKANNSLKPKVSLEHLHFEETGRKLTSSRKPSSARPRQVSPGSSPPRARPVSKGIVVLIPDQSVRNNRSGKLPEVQSSSKKDRNRKGQEIALDQRLGDSFRKLTSERRLDAGDPLKDDDTEVKVDDSSSVSSRPSDLGSGGGSFLLKPPAPEPLAEENGDASCECSETKETIESEFTAEVLVSESRVASSLELVSSCDSVSVPSDPSTVTISQCEQEQEQESQYRVVLPELSASSLAEILQEAEVPPEEEVSKETRMSTGADAPDVDGTSVSSENSGQPSPISVLDSSFEDSPPRVDFDTISSELEELRIQLRLLKWDGNDAIPVEEAQEPTEPTLQDEIIVDKVVVEEKPASIIVVNDHRPGDGDIYQELWLELDEDCYTITPVCPEGRKEEQLYVRNLLLAAKLIRSNHESSSFLVECYSPRQALDPVLFEKLEAYYRARSVDPAGDDLPYTRFKRRHLFDAVNEILTQRFCFVRPWDHPQVLSGGILLGEVWSRLCDYFEYPQGEDLQHTVENLIEKYLTKGDNWMDLRPHVEAVGAEVERLILCDLIEESASCLNL